MTLNQKWRNIAWRWACARRCRQFKIGLFMDRLRFGAGHHAYRLWLRIRCGWFVRYPPCVLRRA